MKRACLHAIAGWVALVCAGMLAACGIGDRMAGGSVSETGNAIAMGVVMGPDGKPAVNASARMIPADYNPLRGGDSLTSNRSITTDSSGSFIIDGLKPGTYNMEARDSRGFKFLLTGIAVGKLDTVILPVDTLRAPGNLIVPLAKVPNALTYSLYIRGTSLHGIPRALQDRPGFAVLDSVASGAACSVFAWATADTGVGIEIGNGIVAAGDTATVSSGLPAPWMNRDIGKIGLGGGTSYAGGTFIVTGSGPDNVMGSDDFHFLFQPGSGDMTVQAKLVQMSISNSKALVGIMVRESLAANAPQISVGFRPTGGLSMNYRSDPGGVVASLLSEASTSPLWLRMVRRGDVFAGFYSKDGTTWVAMDSIPLKLSTAIQVGLFVTSHDAKRSSTVVFDSVSIQTP